MSRVMALSGVGRAAVRGNARPYLVTLARDSSLSASEPDGREHVVKRGLDSSQAFRDHLLTFVSERDWNNELIELGDPTAFGMVSIVSTEALAQEIRAFPEVEDVIEDSPNVRAAV